MRHLRRAAVVGLVVAAIGFGAAQAGATVIESGFYANEPYAFGYDDCGFEVAVEGTASGHFRVRAGKGKTDTAFFVSDNYSYVETHTNVDTGAFLTIMGNAVFNEIKATRVSGNIFEFRAVQAGQPFKVYDADGTLVARDRGSIHYRALFDTLGDDIVGGIFLQDLGADVHGPHPGFDDFCSIVTPLIG